MGYRTTKSKIKVENSKTNNYTKFYYHFFRNILLVGIPLVITSAIILSSIHSSATSSGSGTDSLTISISSACTLSSVVDSEHSTNTNVGTYTSDIGRTTITTLCNDGNGYAVYANGYSNNEEGNNKLINTEYPQYSIDTGLATSGLTSAWAMKLNNIPDDPSPTPPTIESDYNDTYGLIPSYWTKVASRASGTTDMAQGSSFTTTYAIYASSSQYAGTYQGQVKYVLMHPSTKPVYYSMQDVANWGDIELPNIGDSLQAIDNRDGKKYWVTRLADGNIWMTQNLDLDLDPAKPLTSNDTDLTDHSLAGAYANDYNYDADTGITTWTPAASARTIDFQDINVAGWQGSDTTPYSASKTDDTNTGHASIGNYYNWTAAIASNNSSSLTASTYGNVDNNPQNSICPKGWRLPTISSVVDRNEFGTLNNLYNSSATTSDAGWVTGPLYFVRGGIIDNYTRKLADYEISGLYLSSTVSSTGSFYRIILQTNSINMKDGGSWAMKNRGYSMRCVAR